MNEHILEILAHERWQQAVEVARDQRRGARSSLEVLRDVSRRRRERYDLGA